MTLFKNAAVISFFTVLSRITGMVREIFFTHLLGASWMSDAFIVALRLPNFFRQFFAEGAFNAAFVPQFSNTIATEGQGAAKDLARNIFSILTLVLVIFCGFFVLFMPSLMPLIAPGFSKDPKKLDLCITLVRITFPYLAFVSLSALLSGILNSLNRFAIGAAAPLIANVFLIATLVFNDFLPFMPVVSLSLFLTVSGVVQLILLYWAVRKLGFGYLLTIPKVTHKTLKILKLMIPGSISTGVMQVNLFLTMMLASMLPVGSMSYLFYADRLNQLPLALFGISIGTALLPALSKLWKADDKEKAMDIQENAFMMAMLFTIPAAMALIFLANPMIALLFGHGQFTVADVNKTAPALAAFSIGLPAYVMGKILTTTFFATENTKTPVKVSMLTIALNFVLTVILMKFFYHTGMALATSLSSWANVFILAYVLRRKNLFRFSKKLFLYLLKVLLVSFFMGSFTYFIYVKLGMPVSIWQKIANMIILILSGLTFFGCVGYPLKIFNCIGKL
ncbi:MAG: putative lipid II flippase MurJ [Holosporales bacterium]